MSYAGMNLSNKILNEIQLSEQNLKGVNFSSSQLIGADLSYSDLTGADLSSANLSHADLTGAKLDGATINSTKLEGAKLEGTILEEVDQNREERVLKVRRFLPKIKTRLLKELSVLRPLDIQLTFPELREKQRTTLGKTTKEMLVGEYFYLPEGTDYRLLKVDTKNKKTVYVVIKSMSDYESGEIEVLKAKKFLSFKDAWRFYMSSKREMG